MDTTKLNIDRRQIIILVIASVMLVILFIYWQFFYLPKRRQIASILAKVKDFDVNIKEEEARVKAQDYEAEIAKMQEKVAELKEKFPSQNELPGLFQELFNQANKLNIEIISIEPEQPSIYKSKHKFKTDLIFNKVPIKLELRAGYRALAEFLKILLESREYAFTFDDLKISKSKDLASKLEIELLVGAFVLSYKGAAPLEEDLEKGLNLRRRRR